MHPSQGNNAYVFPGVGLGIIACNASRVSERMFLDAAQVLADLVDEEDLQKGSVYPPLPEIRHISLKIAVAVAQRATKQGLLSAPLPADLDAHIADLMYDPAY